MIAPKHYRDALLLAGGTNPYGEPAFILQWGETPVRRRMVSDEYVAHRRIACWMLCEWRPASDYPVTSWPDEIPYPSSGRYEIVQPFREDGEAVRLDTPGLNPSVLRMMVWVVKRHRGDSCRKNLDALKESREKETKAQRERIADCLQSAMPRFHGPVSFRGQRNTRSAVQQKAEQIERQMRYPLPGKLPLGATVRATG